MYELSVSDLSVPRKLAFLYHFKIIFAPDALFLFDYLFFLGKSCLTPVADPPHGSSTSGKRMLQRHPAAGVRGQVVVVGGCRKKHLCGG